MKANFLRFLGIVTLTLVVTAQLAAPVAPPVPADQPLRPIAFEPTPTPTPNDLGGNCGGTTCG